MGRVIRYLTHPQVKIDPSVAIPDWSLSDVGLARVMKLAQSGALAGTRLVVSSTETKAVETATPLAEALGVPVLTRADMGENDRSSTGFLPPDAFEAAADQFFAQPGTSWQGWETARAAQARIVSAVEAVLAAHPEGDVLLVGHGAVGTLLYCHLTGAEIDRVHDQMAGGGAVFDFSDTQAPVRGWTPMEQLYSA